MTTDDGASLAQSKTHEEVRQDIADSDIQQVVDTINAALVVPYITLNFGEQEEYPKLDLFKPDEKNIEQIISAVEKLGPQGLTVKADELRSLIGLSNPKEGDEVIGGRQTFPPLDEEKPATPGELNVAMNAAHGADIDEMDGLIDDGEYAAVSDEIIEVIEKAADAAADFASFQKELEILVSGWPPDKMAECIAVAMFKARTEGAADFDKAE